MVQALCTSGNHEGLKCGVHGAAGAIAALMAAYNIAAFCLRRERHLRVNSVVYTLAVAWEVKQTLRHLRHASSEATATTPAALVPAARCA